MADSLANHFNVGDSLTAGISEEQDEKDENGKAPSVYEDFWANEDILSDSEPIRDCSKPLKMLPKQEAKLEEAVLRELVRIAKDKLSSSREDAKRVLTEKTAAGLPHKTLSYQLEILERKIKNVGEDPRTLYKNKDVYQFNLIDWKRIALEVFPNHAGFDGDFLRQWWQYHLDPTFLRGELTTNEISLLRALTKDCNPADIDFQAIATQISKKLKLQKRHQFQLHQYYQKRFNRQIRTFGWTKEESERLRLLHHEISTDIKILNKHEVWSTMQAHFPERSVSQMQTKLYRLSTPAKSLPTPAKSLPTGIKAVATTSKLRGRPKKPENSVLDNKIADLLKPLKIIRKGRRRTTSLPGDGRSNGMILNAIQRLLPLETDQGNIPREASELVAAGIAKKDIGAVQVMLSLPDSSLNSKVRFPANLASLTGLRGLLLTQEEVSPSVKVQTEQGIPLTEVNELGCFGDPIEDEKLLLMFEKCFGWARPFFDTEAPVDGTEVDGPTF